MKKRVLLIIFSIVLILSLAMILIENEIVKTQITGYATEGSTISNVTISKYLSIDMSTNLSTGILFGNITSLPATNQNASHNYDDGSEGTTMAVNVSTDSNTRVDFCVRANDDLTDPSNQNYLEIQNETYSNSTLTNSTLPAPASETSLDKTTYIKAGENVSIGGATYYRFWLDVPVGTASGTYNNTVMFRGVETTLSCGS